MKIFHIPGAIDFMDVVAHPNEPDVLFAAIITEREPTPQYRVVQFDTK